MNAISLALVCLLVLVPGLGASLLLFGRRDIGLPTRLASMFVLGVVVDGLVAYTLAIAGVLRPGAFFGAVGGVTAVLWFGGAQTELPRLPWDVAYTVDRNEYQGVVRPQVQIKAVRSAF